MPLAGIEVLIRVPIIAWPIILSRYHTLKEISVSIIRGKKISGIWVTRRHGGAVGSHRIIICDCKTWTSDIFLIDLTYFQMQPLVSFMSKHSDGFKAVKIMF